MAPSWAQNRFKIASGADFASDLDFEPSLDRCWIDSGPMLDRFLLFEIIVAVDADVVADVVVNDVTMYYALTLTLASALTLTLS